MTDSDDLPRGWEVWAETDDRLVLVYRPDVFDAAAFPPACLPTIYLTHGQRTRYPGRNPNDRTGRSDWFVTFTLEPEVVVGSTDRHATRERAREAAFDRAARFATGDVDYRAAYQVPRPAYLEKLDELTGRDPPSDVSPAE